jgi:hypothetical protein
MVVNTSISLIERIEMGGGWLISGVVNRGKTVLYAAMRKTRDTFTGNWFTVLFFKKNTPYENRIICIP